MLSPRTLPPSADCESPPAQQEAALASDDIPGAASVQCEQRTAVYYSRDTRGHVLRGVADITYCRDKRERAVTLRYLGVVGKDQLSFSCVVAARLRKSLGCEKKKKERKKGKRKQEQRGRKQNRETRRRREKYRTETFPSSVYHVTRRRKTKGEGNSGETLPRLQKKKKKD